MITHLVLFKLKPGVARDDRRVVEAVAALTALRGMVGGIERWEHGWNISDRAIAYDFALDSTFTTRDALAAYGPHPAHQAAVALLREVMDWVLCDFEAGAVEALQNQIMCYQGKQE